MAKNLNISSNSDARLTRVEKKVDVLAKDVKVLKSDVAILKTDVVQLKTDVANLKIDVAILKIDMKEVKVDLKEVKSDTHQILTTMDHYIRLYEKQDQEFLIFSYRTNERFEKAEARLDKLEARRK